MDFGIFMKSWNKGLKTQIFVFYFSNLWPLFMAEYFNKNFADYEAGFSSRGDFLSYQSKNFLTGTCKRWVVARPEKTAPAHFCWRLQPQHHPHRLRREILQCLLRSVPGDCNFIFIRLANTTSAWSANDTGGTWPRIWTQSGGLWFWPLHSGRLILAVRLWEQVQCKVRDNTIRG